LGFVLVERSREMLDKLDGMRKRVDDLRASLAEAVTDGSKAMLRQWLREAEQDLAWELNKRAMVESEGMK
jgi:hypothetical protein